MRKILSIFLLFAYSIGCSMDSRDDEGIGSLFPTPVIPEKNGSPGQDVNRDINDPPVAVEVFVEENVVDPADVVEPAVAAELVDNIAPQIVSSTVKHGDINVDVDIDHFVFTFSESIAGTNFIKLIDNTTGLPTEWVPFVRDKEIEISKGDHGFQLIGGHVYTITIRVADVAHNWTDPFTITFVTELINFAAEERAKISFRNDIQPILAERCGVPGCHAFPGVAGLDLSKYDTFKKGGNGGPAFVAGDGKGSLVVKRIDGGGMPPGGPPLNGDQVQLFIDWIDKGAENN